MTIEIDPRLELCYKLAKKDRDTFSPQIRESLDKTFLRLIRICEKSRNLAVEDLKAEFKHIIKSIDGVDRKESIKEY
jgi:hypothetical protein